jgi:hypothetical protein
VGVHKNVSYELFPTQGQHLHKRVTVCFAYDTKRTIGGLVVRDDLEDPFRMIIALDDGRYIDATECQYSLADKAR